MVAAQPVAVKCGEFPDEFVVGYCLDYAERYRNLPFIDHINEKDPKKPSQWFVQCGKEEDAKELARLLKEEAEKQ